MKAYFVAVFFLWSATLEGTSECSCDPAADLRIGQLQDADLIFKGHVINKRTEYFPSLGYRYVATFVIDDVISGKPQSSLIEIEYGYGETYCLINFQPLFNYLVVAKNENGFPYFKTNYCSGNKRWEDLSRKDIQLIADFRNGNPLIEVKDGF